ncbi:hypothetical protein ACI65C_006475 [Semiaphis heraclei]
MKQFIRTKLTIQLFIKSVAVGLRFYRDRQPDFFKDSIETEQFTLMLNNIFDAVNQKFPKEGIKQNSHDLEVLNEGKQWLDSWKSNYDDSNITADEFLTQQTAEGLRVTVQSYIDITLYLLDKCNFSYVLTSKLNQDYLEKFFGVIRQIAGPNDHPSTPTFLQLYRMLNVYSLLKPPKSGHCKVDEENKSILDIIDLKELMNDTSVRKEKVKKLKQKIDILIEEGDEDPEDIFLEHDYLYKKHCF